MENDKPAFVIVTPAMEKAGVEELREQAGEPDLAYVARSVYMAMEYQRLADAGQLGDLTDEALKDLKRRLKLTEVGPAA